MQLSKCIYCWTDLVRQPQFYYNKEFRRTQLSVCMSTFSFHFFFFLLSISFHMCIYTWLCAIREKTNKFAHFFMEITINDKLFIKSKAFKKKIRRHDSLNVHTFHFSLSTSLFSNHIHIITAHNISIVKWRNKIILKAIEAIKTVFYISELCYRYFLKYKIVEKIQTKLKIFYVINAFNVHCTYMQASIVWINKIWLLRNKSGEKKNKHKHKKIRKLVQL